MKYRCFVAIAALALLAGSAADVAHANALQIYDQGQTPLNVVTTSTVTYTLRNVNIDDGSSFESDGIGTGIGIRVNGVLIPADSGEFTSAGCSVDESFPNFWACNNLSSAGASQTYSFTWLSPTPGINTVSFQGVCQEIPIPGTGTRFCDVYDARGNNVGWGGTVFTRTTIYQNTPPVIANPGNQVNYGGDFVNLPISASDPDEDVLTFSATGLPPLLSIDPGKGVIFGLVSDSLSDAHLYNVTVIVTDNGDPSFSTSVSFQWDVRVNQPPVVSDPGDQVSNEGEVVSLQIVASDPNGDVLTFAAMGLPPGLQIDSTSGLIWGTVSFESLGTYSVTVTVTDSRGLSALTVIAWTIVGYNPPLVQNPGDQMGREGQAVSLQIQASDPDGDTISYEAANLPRGLDIATSSGVISGTIEIDTEGSYPVTITVTDDSVPPLSTTVDFVWTVLGNKPPVVEVPANQIHGEGAEVSLRIRASDPNEDVLTFDASNLPGGLSIEASTGLITGTVEFGAAGDYEVIVTVTDSGIPPLSASVNFVWTVIAGNNSPVVQNPGDQTNAEGQTVSLQIAASDPNGDALTFAAENLPSGLEIDPATGLISGTLLTGTTGSYQVTVTVTDNGAPPLSTSISFTWGVGAANRPPVVTNPGDQTNAEGQTVSLQIAASDPNGDALTFAAQNLPSGLEIDPATGLISGTLVTGTTGSYQVTVTVTDNGVPPLSTSISFTWGVGATNRPPVVTNPGNQTNAEGQTVSLQIAASDPNSDALTFAAGNLPSGLEIDPTTGLISGTLVTGTTGSYQVTVTVTDNGAPPLSTSISFTWGVGAANRPPVVTNPGDQANLEGESVSLPIAASDPNENGLSFSATGLPPGLTISVSLGRISGTIAPGSAGIYSVVVTVTDDGSPALSASVSFSWNVGRVNQPPIVQSPGDQSSDEGELVSLAISATDPDEDNIVFAATGLPPGLSINTSTGNIGGTIAFGSAGTFNVTVTVTDTSSPPLADSVTFTWVVASVNRAPEILAPPDQASSEGDAVSLQLTASDPDADGLTFAADNLPPNLRLNTLTGLIDGSVSFDAAGSYLVAVSVTDDGSPSLSDQVTFTWNVNDVVPVTVAVAEPVAEGATVEVVATTAVSLNASTAELRFREGGGVAFTSVGFSRTGDRTYAASIPGNRVTARGIEFFARFIDDGFGTLTYPEVNPEEAPARISVQVAGVLTQVVLEAESYSMFSVPLQLANPNPLFQLEDDYGEYDGDVWRLLRWNPLNASGDEYEEPPRLTAQLLPGNAFWLISRDGSRFDIGDASSVDASGPFVLRLHPGWNQIGNPFSFDVAWSSMETEGLEAPWAYTGDVSPSWAPGVSILEPWQGYFVYNQTESAIDLGVPPEQAAAKSMDKDGIPIEAAYYVRLEAEVEGSNEIDIHNYVGFSALATNERDRLDIAEPPEIGRFVRLSILEQGERLAVSLKAVTDEGQYWDLTVDASQIVPRLTPVRDVTVSLVESGERPQGFEVFVLDLDRGRALPLESGTFTLQLGSDGSPQRLRLIIGSAAYAEAQGDGIPVYPVAMTLDRNYPNPFTARTVIRYQLSQHARVSLAIYDLVGRSVRSLVQETQDAGYHSVEWDGLGDSGSPVASGIYLYRITAEDYDYTRKMVLVR